jgi:polysaccharide pyruvyl transferase WcaK-like protein
MRFHSAVFAQQQAIPHYNIVYHEKVSSLNQNIESFFNKSKNIACIDSINNFISNINDELLLKERSILIKNRNDTIEKMKVHKKVFLDSVSKIKSNHFKNSLKYRIINKVIKWIH